jgi:hypothetical protein
VVPVETASWAPIALTVLGGQTVVMLQEVKRPPLNGADLECTHSSHASSDTLSLFCQDDVPSELVSSTASLLRASSDAHDKLDIGLLDVPDEDDGSTIDAVLNLAKGKKFSIDRKEVVPRG